MRPTICNLEQIKTALRRIDVVKSIENGFIAYSRKRVVVPPVGEMIFDDPPGDVHIKYGFITGDDHYVIKIASGFYENPSAGLPSGNGLMLVFSQRTGELKCILLDEGYLTDIRTAAAGAVAARHLAPGRIEAVGILGAGTQGRLQLEFLKPVTPCRTAWVWGIDAAEIDSYRKDLGGQGFEVRAAAVPGDIAARCNLIVTATPSKKPLLLASQIRPGTHITAVGSDTSEKIELDPEILGRADVVVADSLSQCRHRGEIHQALKAGVLEPGVVKELGEVIQDGSLGRTSDSQISVVDLTGVAVQDIQIATAVYAVLKRGAP